jgi:hypothetical protein
MKSVSFSEIVYTRDIVRWPHPRQGWGRLASFALVMVLGLAALAALFHLMDPTAPLVYVVVPVVAGGILPIYLFMPARFEVTTRFEARHLLGTLDQGLAARGYERVAETPELVRYLPRSARPVRLPLEEITVTVRPHAVDIAGPAITLRALQKVLAR